MAKSPQKITPPRLPYLAGITGGIGAGKSAVSAIVARRHPVLYSDSIAKELLAHDKAVVAEVKRAFGNEAYASDGHPDRAFLASAVFSNPEKLKTLNSIIHPRTLKAMFAQAQELERGGANIVFVESALLYEAKVHKHYDAIIAVVAEEELILQRMTESGKFSKEDIERRIANQLPQDDKAARADYVIRNNGSLAELEQSTNLIVRIIESMAKLHGTPRS